MTATNPVGANKAASRQTGDSAGAGQAGLAVPAHQVEFLPERIRHHRRRRSRLVHQGYLLVMCVAVMGVLTCVRAERAAQARSNLAWLEKSRISLQKQAATITSLEYRMADLQIKKRIDEELGSRTDCTAVLAELCRITPPSVVMLSLDLQTAGLPADDSEQPSPTAGTGAGDNDSKPAVVAKISRDEGAAGIVRRTRMVIVGLAINDVEVANFIGRLSASPLLEDVNMGYTGTIVLNGQSVRKFQALCYLAQPAGQS